MKNRYWDTLLLIQFEVTALCDFRYINLKGVSGETY